MILGPCEACDGHGYRHIGWRTVSWYEPDIEITEPCEECEGTGEAEIEAHPIECEDLEPLVPAL